ncbi:MAG: hypothetical protein KBT03_04635 [Bacteroidales bacterium]|nr:hypothetical protein [Candidatus Scybalousia scybalohippi]
MTRKTNDEPIGYFEGVEVIINDFESELIAFEMDNNFEMGEGLYFKDVLEEAKKRGYKRGTILLIMESYLDGEIYRYGNYKDDDSWVKVGTMEGFA